MKGAVSYEDGMAEVYGKRPEMGIEALNACLEDGDVEMFLVTLGHIARARGLARIAEETGLQKNTLYRTLSEEGNPTLRTLVAISRALGMEMRFAPHAYPQG